MAFQFLNELSNLMYSGAKLGFSLDFLFIAVRSKPMPFKPFHYRVDTLPYTMPIFDARAGIGS